MRSPRPATTCGGGGGCSSSWAGCWAPIAASWGAASAMGEEALAIARREGDEELEMLSAATLSTSALLAGRAFPDLMAGAGPRAGPRVAAALGRWPQLFRARHCLGGHLDEARERFEGMQQVFQRRGIEFQRPYRLNDLAWVEVLAGNLRTAVELTDDASGGRVDAGNAQARVWAVTPPEWPTPISAVSPTPAKPPPTCGRGASSTTSRPAS